MTEPQGKGCLFAILQLFSPSDEPEANVKEDTTGTKTKSLELTYIKKSSLMTPTELEFFHALKLAELDYLVFSKVRIADLIEARGEKRSTLFNKIKAKHVDFVLCAVDTAEPVLAIELDDASHQRSSRQKRDEFVDEALKSAGLRLMRVKAAHKYSSVNVRKAVGKFLTDQ